jgi:hypothetical protein
MPARRPLLAGSVGPERFPVRPDPGVRSWYEPPHVRDVRSARQRLAGQVAAGADVIVAPTWLTHRRALLPVGETRQARAWTAAAVRVAREAVEVGVEERNRESTAAEDSDGTLGAGPGGPPEAGARRRIDHPRPLVAATLPALDDEPDVAGGRLMPRETAGERDYRDQAGLLADAEPDLLLVEGQASIPALRAALDAATATGLLTWVALSGLAGGRTAVATESPVPALQAALEAIAEAALDLVLLPPPFPASLPDAGRAWGGLLVRPADEPAGLVTSWLDAGAVAVALLDGATPSALRLLREAIDAVEREQIEASERRERRWSTFTGNAARLAPGGAALWLVDPMGRGPSPDVLPAGFEWLVLDRSEAPRLPVHRYRRIVDQAGGPGAVSLAAPLLEDGGVLVLGDVDPQAGLASRTLRVVTVDETAQPPLAILRREPR